MALEHRRTGLTYRDLEEMFPDEDMVIRELLDGELFVTPPPTNRHQRVIRRLLVALDRYAERAGGEVFQSPTGVLFDAPNFVEPDILFIGPGRQEWLDERYLRVAPDLVVEVSSPSTRSRDLGKKRETYERFGVPEFWFVDLEHAHVEVHRLVEGRFAAPEILGRGATLAPVQVEGFAISVDEVLGPPED